MPFFGKKSSKAAFYELLMSNDDDGQLLTPQMTPRQSRRQKQMSKHTAATTAHSCNEYDADDCFWLSSSSTEEHEITGVLQQEERPSPQAVGPESRAGWRQSTTDTTEYGSANANFQQHHGRSNAVTPLKQAPLSPPRLHRVKDAAWRSSAEQRDDLETRRRREPLEIVITTTTTRPASLVTPTRQHRRGRFFKRTKLYSS